MAVSTTIEFDKYAELRWVLPWTRRFYLCNMYLVDGPWFTFEIGIFQTVEKITLELKEPVDDIKIDFTLEGDR